jgi:uncharacterized protein YegL
MLNPAARLPVAVVLDTSGSMDGEPIAELRGAVDRFLADLAADDDARASCDVAFLGVGERVSILRPFGLAHVGGLTSALEADGPTPLGEGVVAALDLLEQRKEQYRTRRLRYFQPWLVVITDGQPTDDTDLAQWRVARAREARRLTVFPVAVGPRADVDRLRALAGGVDPARLRGLEFRRFFQWLSASVSVVSRSQPGQGLALPSPFEWIDT